MASWKAYNYVVKKTYTEIEVLVLAPNEEVAEEKLKLQFGKEIHCSLIKTFDYV